MRAWVALVLGVLGMVVAGSGCATLQAQAQSEKRAESAIILEDVGKYLKAEVACDPALVAQLVGAIYTMNVSLLSDGLACLPVAAKALAAQLRTETAPLLDKQHAQVVATMAQTHGIVRAWNQSKQGP